MKYVYLVLLVLSTVSAQARPYCSGTCTLVGPNVNEKQAVSYFDDYLQRSFSLEDVNGFKITGYFTKEGFGYCGKLSSVNVTADGRSYSWKDREVIFNLDGELYKFSCDYKGNYFYESLP